MSAVGAVAPPVLAAFDRLLEARRTGVPCAPVRDLIALDRIDEAYLVQTAWVDLRRREGVGVVGRKIGLTNPAVQTQLGVDSPDFGFLLADMRVEDGGTVAPGTLLQPRVEAEIAFVLGADLDVAEPTEEDVLEATASVVASLELVDSRIAGWDIRLVDTVADNASAGAFVLGTAARPLDLDLTTVEMTMTRNGEVLSEGTGADCMGSPLAAVAWLARTCAAFGRPLRAGEIVLSGALGRVVDAHPDDGFAATIAGLGSVSVRFGATS